jgi:hypothetical protein
LFVLHINNGYILTMSFESAQDVFNHAIGQSQTQAETWIMDKYYWDNKEIIFLYYTSQIP